MFALKVSGDGGIIARESRSTGLEFTVFASMRIEGCSLLGCWP